MRATCRAPALFAVAFAAALAALSAALCSCSRAEPEGGAITLRYLASPDVGGSTRELIRRFEARNPGIRVRMVEGPGSTDARANMYSTAFMGGRATYDIVHMDVIWVPKFASQGWLRPLDDRFPPDEQAKFLPGDIAGSKYQGRIYRVPSQSDGGLLYYRKDLLEARGLKPPETFAELAAAAKAVAQPPRLWGFVFQGKQYEGLVCAYLEVLWGHGGDVLGPGGAVRLAEPEAVAALDWLVAAVREGLSPPGVLTYQEEEARNMFQEGRAVFMRNWPYAWNLLQGENSPVRGKVGVRPMVHAPGAESAATLGGWGYGISAFSEQPDAAWKFVEFITGEEAQRVSFLMGGINPTRRALFSDPELLRKSPHLPQLYAALERARPRPVHEAYARISDALQVHASAALSGQRTAREALDEAAREIAPFVR